jgi:hypothetical protein
MSSQNVPQDADRTRAEENEVPAGGAGADSGAASTVGVDHDDTAGVQNISSQNDIAGVGTRGPDEVASSTGADATAVEQERRAADPDFVRDDEAAGAAAHNARVSARDAGEDAERVRRDDDYQHLPRMAQNAPTRDEELAGIVAQTKADMALGIPEERAREIVRQRLDDTGIDYDDDALDELARRVLAPE